MCGFITSSFLELPNDFDTNENPLGLTISPNPVTEGNVTFHFKVLKSGISSDNATIQLTNLIGQQVYLTKLSDVDLSRGYFRLEIEQLKLDKGIYFVKFSVAEYSKVQKMILR
jgi:5-hydroxyisourate hydrolase-like protein (transthyretin family)